MINPFAALHGMYVRDLRRVYRLLPGRLRAHFWLIFALHTLQGVIMSMTILVISALFMALSGSFRADGHNVRQRMVTMWLPDSAMESRAGPQTLMLAMGVVVVAFTVVKVAVTALAVWNTNRFSERLGLFVQSRAMDEYLHRDYLWHLGRDSRDVLHRMGQRGQLARLVIANIGFFGNVIAAAFLFGLLAAVSPAMTVAMGLVFAVVGLATYVLIRKRVDHGAREAARLGAEEAALLHMTRDGIREIIIYRREDAFHGRLDELARRGLPYKTFNHCAPSIPAWTLEIAGFACVLAAMSLMVAAGADMPRILSAISVLLLCAWQLLPLVNRAITQTVNLRSLRPRAEQCLSLAESLGGDAGAEMEKAVPDPDWRFGEVIGLADAGFRYPGAGADCLHGIGLSVPRGGSLGLVGASGAGKSTLAMLFSGLLPPTSGSLVVDGRPQDAAGRAALRQRVGYVPQTPLLQPGTIAENVALAEWGKPVDRGRVARACRLAAMDFVADHPAGIDRPLGEGGRGLSGGQLQRLAIARALFTEPEILILDEATSSLDAGSEQAIADVIKSLSGRITTLVIAHRLTTVEHCDRLAWLDGGRVRMEGPPATVLPAYKQWSAAAARKA